LEKEYFSHIIGLS